MRAIEFLFAVALAAIGLAVSLVLGASDHAEFLAARILFSAAAVLIAANGCLWDHRSRVSASRALRIVLGCCGALTLLVLFFLSFRWVSLREGALLSATSAKTLSDDSVSMECMLISGPPHKFPADGVIYLIEFASPSQHLGRLESYITGEPGGNLTWPDYFPLFGQRCKVSNIGSVTALDLDIEIPVRFFEAKRMHSRGYEYGKQIDTETWNLPKNSLVLSPNESFEFYMWNLGPYVVDVRLPTRGKARSPGQQAIQEFLLKRTSHDPLLFSPAPEPKHPSN